MALGDSELYIHKIPAHIYDDDGDEPSNYIRLVNSQNARVVFRETPYIEHAFHDGHITVSFYLRSTNTTMSYNMTWSLSAYIDRDKTGTVTVANGQYYVSKFTSAQQSARLITLDIQVPEKLTYYDEDFNPVETVFDPNLLYQLSVGDKLGSGSLYFRTDHDAYADVWYFLPSAPSVPAVTANPPSLAAGQSVLRWPASAPGVNNPVTAYKVYRRTHKAPVTWKLMEGGELPPTQTSFTVESAEGNGNWYEFAVEAIGTIPGWDSEKCDPVRLTTEWDAPLAPTGLTLSSSIEPPGNPVTLSWTPGGGGLNNPPQRYDIYRQADVYDYELIGSSTTTRAVVYPPVENGTTYRYKVQAIGTVEGVDSELSAASDGLRTSFTAPSIPGELRVNGKTSIYLDAGSTAQLTWLASADGVNNPLQGYNIYNGSTLIGESRTNSYTMTASSVAGETMRITVRARGAWSESQPSSAVEVTTTLPPVPPRSNEAISQFLLFDRNDNLILSRDDAISMRAVEEEFRLNGSFPYRADKALTCGMRIGWLEGDELRLYEIRQPETDLQSMVQDFEAEHVAISELSDMVIEEFTYPETEARQLVEYLLQGTGWSVGKVTAETEAMDAVIEYSSVWSALLTVRESYGVEIVPRLAYTYDGIERYIDILDRRGEYRGVRLALDLNVQKAGVIYDDREQFTALYGLGATYTTEDAEGNKTEHKTTFDGVEWSMQDGRPADKPLGQKYVEDVSATAQYGRKGKPRIGMIEFSEITNQHILLQATWDALQAMKTPKVTISMTAFDLGTIGYASQGIALGDDVVVILDPIGVELVARVTKFDRDILRPEQSRPTIGDVREDIISKIQSASKQQIAVNGGYTIDVDPSLSVDGMAADAKVVGDFRNRFVDSVGNIPELTSGSLNDLGTGYALASGGCTNRPTTGNEWYYILTLMISETEKMQLAWLSGSTRRMYYRQQRGGSWWNWNTVLLCSSTDSAVDLNDYTVTGSYYFSGGTLANKPSNVSSNYCHMLVISNSGGAIAMQLLTPVDPSHEYLYMRKRNSGGWGRWIRLDIEDASNKGLIPLWTGNKVLNDSGGFTLSGSAMNYKALMVCIQHSSGSYEACFQMIPGSSTFAFQLMADSMIFGGGTATWADNNTKLTMAYKLRFYKTSATAGGNSSATYNVTAIYGMK